MSYHAPFGSYASGYDAAQAFGQLEQFTQITGIEDVDNISSKEFEEIQRLAGEGLLGRETLAAAIQYIPNYLELQKESIQTLRTTVDKISSSQTQALDILENIQQSLDAQLRIFEILATSAQTDHTHLQLAMVTIEVGRQQIELAKIVAQVNRDNNLTLKEIAGYAAAGVAAVAVGIGMGIAILLRGGQK